MDSRVAALPGEPPLLPGTPLGLRIITALPLEAFKLANVGNPELALLLFGFRRSADRRIKEGPHGLMHEAARDLIVAILPRVRRIYRTRGFDVHLNDEAIDAVAAKLAKEMAASSLMKEQANEFIEAARTIILQTEECAAINPDVFELPAIVSARSTMNRWIDYIEYLNIAGKYEPSIKMHRFLVHCSRMYDAVFLRNN